MQGSWLRSILLAVAPPSVVLGFLTYGAHLSPKLALSIGIAVFLGAAVAVRRRLAAEQVVMRRLNRLTAEAQSQLNTLSYNVAVSDRILSSLPDPIFFLDQERRVVRTNSAARGVIESDLTGRDIADGLRDPALLLAIDQAIEGNGGQMVDLSLPVPVQTEYIARVEPVEPPPGATASSETPIVLVDLQDVTALRRSEQMRVDFVANVSHELRTPLTSLTGFIETLRGPARDDPDAREKFLAIMQDQSQRMFRLISDLLSLSQIELDEHSRPSDAVDIRLVLIRLIELLSQKAEKAGLRIDTIWPDDLPAVQGDADQLTQVFQNLLDNAIKYGADGEAVTIRTSVRDFKKVVVEITDQGPGIPKDQLPRLTERFYRVDAARSRELGGTGLGLAIVKHIVNRHRGRLTISSEEGSGSTFAVQLPVIASI